MITQLYRSLICALGFSVGGMLAAEQSSRPLKGGLYLSEKTVERVIPNEYAAFRRQWSQKNSSSDAEAALKLLNSTRTAWEKMRDGVTYNKDYIDAHAVAWRICLQIWTNTKNQAVRRSIIDEWNMRLKGDGDEIPLMFAVVGTIPWSRELLTNDFWQLLDKTTKPKTLSAICYILYEYGEAGDGLVLENKRKTIVDADVRSILGNAINWIHYKYAKDGERYEPAHIGPTLEID